VTRAVVVAIAVALSLPATSSAGVVGSVARAPGRLAGRAAIPKGGGMTRTAGAGRASTAPARQRRPAVLPVRPRGGPVTRAAAPVRSRGGRRPAVAASPRGRPGVVGRSGDAALGFVRRNKGPLAVAAALAAFVHDPGPFLDVAGRLVTGAAGAVAQSAAGLPPMVGAGTARWPGWAGPAALALALAGLRLLLVPSLGRARRRP
jgi:hypothetical protein